MSGRLPHDCFALPPGIDWTPVDVALERLRTRLAPVTGTERVSLAQAAGRFLAEDVGARRANPAAGNSAVDGYGFARAAATPTMRLVAGRAAAGRPFAGAVPAGAAVRILTGAALPEGVDTVAMQEDASIDGAALTLAALPKAGANTRRAGEDAAQGQTILTAGARLRPQDLALLAACGHDGAPVRARLRVGVLSTGDEIEAPGAPAAEHQVYDANRPMLLAQIAAWGFEAVDLGHAADAPVVVRERLDAGAAAADVILTSGGASTGDEDHVAALLKAEGLLAVWRIAVKPGRPLAMALWRGVPVFGLPGNPVAAFVCTLVFGAPALRVLAGGEWRLPRGWMVPAGFAKDKKRGRREYLRARLGTEGTAEVFRSEGSGLISGLTWSDGLVELPDEGMSIQPGTPVRYIPYTAFAP
ncbi:molybdopterin-binding protein [Acuticoccus sp. I52.16.1]|uniref:molybdopterin-binding protein n=1 Tax=Acuticoccus sp. I52.16.1 TaxID=2928472 RepID=UPI001FD14224|nr:molybdopterin-binding protein [Acuticoccus sp. I52.16.1]UOM34420.1 molybdopterin-binding protein [Acuticoccus sp. I52.16.1]